MRFETLHAAWLPDFSPAQTPRLFFFLFFFLLLKQSAVAFLTVHLASDSFFETFAHLVITIGNPFVESGQTAVWLDGSAPLSLLPPRRWLLFSVLLPRRARRQRRWEHMHIWKTPTRLLHPRETHNKGSTASFIVHLRSQSLPSKNSRHDNWISFGTVRTWQGLRYHRRERVNQNLTLCPFMMNSGVSEMEGEKGSSARSLTCGSQ